MNILITGSEGTLGKPLTKELERRGHNVFGADLAHTSKSHVNYIRTDVRQMEQVMRAFSYAKPDVVYHLAAEFGRVNGEEYYPQLWTTNMIGTENVIKACTMDDVKFILAGSSEAYGDSSDMMLFEDVLDHAAPLFHNQYAMSKWAQEQQTFLAQQHEGLKAVVLRFFNAYGEGEYYSPYRSVVCLFCYRLLTGLPINVYQNYHRVFMHVDNWTTTVANVAERFDRLPLRNSIHPTPVYNIGGSEYRSVEELADIIVDLLPTKELRDRAKDIITYIPKEKANVVNKRPNIELAMRDLDHNPVICLEEGVARTIKWMQETYGI